MPNSWSNLSLNPRGCSLPQISWCSRRQSANCWTIRDWTNVSCPDPVLIWSPQSGTGSVGSLAVKKDDLTSWTKLWFVQGSHGCSDWSQAPRELSHFGHQIRGHPAWKWEFFVVMATNRSRLLVPLYTPLVNEMPRRVPEVPDVPQFSSGVPRLHTGQRSLP